MAGDPGEPGRAWWKWVPPALAAAAAALKLVAEVLGWDHH